MDPTGKLLLIYKALWTLPRYVRSSLCVSSDLSGVNPTTLNRMILYYRLMTKWSGLGDSTELSWMGLSHWATQRARVARARSLTGRAVLGPGKNACFRAGKHIKEVMLYSTRSKL
jgi:hypothetical protein